jgi:hypothetical protein
MSSLSFMKIRSIFKNADFGQKRPKFFSYFHRFRFAASLSLDFDQYSKKDYIYLTSLLNIQIYRILDQA